MKKIILSAVLGLLATTVYAVPADFTKADTNKDGALSTEEAQKALPGIAITDNNKDGMLNQTEIEKALPGLMFAGDGKAKETRLVGANEYKQIVQAVARMEHSKKG